MMPPAGTEDAVAQGRVPPQALDVERTVLGSMLIDPSALDSAMEVLTEDCFYNTSHRRIYLCVRDMYRTDVPVDIITLAEQLRKQKWLEGVGSEVYLSELVENVATSANIAYHAKILESKATLRQMIAASSETVTECFDSDAEARAILDKAETRIFQISDAGIKNKPSSLKELLPFTFEEIDRYAKEGGFRGVATGFTGLDEMTTGFHPGDLVVIASRPGMGKTALCLSIAMNTAVLAKKPTPAVLFSLEMSKDQVVQRLLCANARLNIHRLRGGRLTPRERQGLGFAAGPLHEAPMFIDDTPDINVLELRAKCRRLKARENIGLVIIDYLQLMGSVDRVENRQQEIAHISRSLKSIAKELGLPVVALSQLSRAVEQRGGDRRPQLSDLRESGAIEQDADLVMFIYREIKYRPEKEEVKKIAEIIIGKQRNGPVGTVKLEFEEEFASFSNLEMHLDEMSEVERGF